MKITVQHLEFIRKQIDDIHYHYNKSEVGIVPFFYLGLLERLYCATVGLNALIGKIEEVPELEYSAGLIIRTTILDLMIGAKGYDIIVKGTEAGLPDEEIRGQVEDFCNRVLADGVEMTGKQMVTVHSQGGLTDEELHENLGGLAGNYTRFVGEYNGDAKPPRSRFGKAMNATEIYKSFSDDEISSLMALQYPRYTWFSKYEHFSAMSFTVMRQPTADQHKVIMESGEVFVLHAFTCTHMLKEYIGDEFITDKAARFAQYIGTEILGRN